MQAEHKELFTIPETGEIINAKPTHVRKLIAHNELKAVRMGKKLLVPKSAIDEFIASLKPYNEVQA